MWVSRYIYKWWRGFAFLHSCIQTTPPSILLTKTKAETDSSAASNISCSAVVNRIEIKSLHTNRQTTPTYTRKNEHHIPRPHRPARLRPHHHAQEPQQRIPLTNRQHIVLSNQQRIVLFSLSVVLSNKHNDNKNNKNNPTNPTQHPNIKSRPPTKTPPQNFQRFHRLVSRRWYTFTARLRSARADAGQAM
jgi:hypothetical protein